MISEDQLNLVKGLSKNGIYGTVYDNCTKETFDAFNVHRTLFVVDTMCQIAENCLKMVKFNIYVLK